MIGIYCIKNMLNGKMYVGKSVNTDDRLDGHMRSLNNNSHHSIKLQRAWNKYSSDNFICGVIEECDECNLDAKERYYIDLYDSHKSGYNCVTPTGISSGYHHTEETKRKHSASMRIAHTRMAPDVKKRVFDALKNSPHGGGAVDKGVLVYDLIKFELIESFNTTDECSKFIGCSSRAVNKAIDQFRRNERLSFYGYILIRNNSTYDIEWYKESRYNYQLNLRMKNAIKSGMAIINKQIIINNRKIWHVENTENRLAAWKKNSDKARAKLKSKYLVN